MASKAERREQERREKKRLKDKQRQREARERRRASRVRPDALPGLPLGECFASENWHEEGAVVWAAVSRLHPNGKLAAALFHIDLSAGTLRAERLLPELSPGQLEGELGRVAGERLAVAVCEPTLVAALVHAVLPDGPTDRRPALRLLDGIDPHDCPHEIRVGPPSAPVAPVIAAPGRWARLLRWLRGA